MGGFILDFPTQAPDIHRVFSLRTPSRLANKDIHFEEMKAVLIALWRWISELAGKALYIFNDNQAVCYGLVKLSIRGPAMAPLRDIAMLLAQHDILVVEVKWIHSYENSLADMLSRMQYDKIADI